MVLRRSGYVPGRRFVGESRAEGEVDSNATATDPNSSILWEIAAV
jgi:hypothetical protein